MCHNHDDCGMNDLRLLFEWGISGVYLKFEPIPNKGKLQKQSAYVSIIEDWRTPANKGPNIIEGRGMTLEHALHECREKVRKL